MGKEIKQFCSKWNIKELSVFGSALTDKFNKDSDIDILVSFYDNSHYGSIDTGIIELKNIFFDVNKADLKAESKAELQKIFGREVDLVTRKSVERSPNFLRSNSILSNLKLIYAE